MPSGVIDDQPAARRAARPVAGRRILEEHVREIQLALQPGRAFGEREPVGELLRLHAGRDDLLVERALLLRALDVVGPHRPEHVELVGADLAEICRVHHAAGQDTRCCPPSPDDGIRAVHHALLERPSDRVRELILGMHVQRKLGARIHPHQADLRVASPDQPRLCRCCGDRLRPCPGSVSGVHWNLVQIDDDARLERGRDTLIGKRGFTPEVFCPASARWSSRTGE